MRKKIHVISHTHWDREWYLTFDAFRYRLVQLIDRLLDLLEHDSEFTCFHLDGQTIVLNDYLELRPSQKERIEQHIRNGKILIGPWYQQNDLFLTSAESTVRNLLKGIKISREISKEMKVGYLPDHFGLIGQMPQILNGFGLTVAMMGRGYTLESHYSPFFNWSAPDGTKVKGILMPHWYNNAQRFPREEDQLTKLFEWLMEREMSTVDSPHYVLMNGVDHLEPQYDLSEILSILRSKYDDQFEITQSTLEDYTAGIVEYMDTVSDTETAGVESVEGELREGSDYEILAGTLSCRYPLKKANANGHDVLEKWLEPLSVYTGMLNLHAVDTGALDYLWKLYMENHPHDSICGCHQDEIFHHMMDRYQRLQELSTDMTQQIKCILARQLDVLPFDHNDQAFILFNTASVPSSMILESEVRFLSEDNVSEFVIEDVEGNPVTYEIVSVQKIRTQVLSSINLPGILHVTAIKIKWQPHIPPHGYTAYRIRPHQKIGKLQTEPEIWTASGTAPYLENKYLRVEIHQNGSFRMLNKSTGRWYDGLGTFADDGDRGDLYVFTKTDESTIYCNQKVTFESWKKCKLYDECIYSFQWLLPEKLNVDGVTRSHRKKSCEVRVKLLLGKETKHVSLDIQLENNVRDHRLRMCFPFGMKSDSIIAGAQFDAVSREWEAHVQPFWKWVAQRNQQDGLAVFAKGLYEYEALENGFSSAITLLRGVENIFFREEVPLEQDIQPDAQCLGKHTFSLAVRPYDIANETTTQIYQEAELFHQGIQTHLFPVDQIRWQQGRSWVQADSGNSSFQESNPNEGKPKLALQSSMIHLDGNVVISALKASEDGNDIILRIFNVETELSRFSVAFQTEVQIKAVYEVDLSEHHRKMIPFDKDQKQFKGELRSKGICTYRIQIHSSFEPGKGFSHV